MQSLPILQGSGSTVLSLLQTRWASILNPILRNPITNGNLLTGIAVSSGDNVINHLLGRTPQGWFLTDSNAAVTVYRSAAFNPTTLTLNSSGSATINLYVF